MLDVALFRDEPDLIRRGLERRGEDPSIVDTIRELDVTRRETLTELETLRATRNTESKAIGRTKDADERKAKIAAMREVNERIGALETSLGETEGTLQRELNEIPNVPSDLVPDGADETQNVVVREVGAKPDLDGEPLPHWDLGEALGIIDFERGVRMSGSRFYVLTGAGSRLQRALIQFMLDFHTARGYTEVYPPFMVSEQRLWDAGQLPKFRDNLYHDAEEDLPRHSYVFRFAIQRTEA